MEALRHLLFRLRAVFQRNRLEREMAEEMRFHLARRAAEHVIDGMPPDEARNAAQRAFGGVEQIKERARDQHRIFWLEDFVRNLRIAFRQLIKSPGFTLLAVITLGLGIGANTAMFSVLNSVMLKPLPYPDSAQLDRIFRTTAQNTEGGVSPADFFDLRRESDRYGEVAACAFTDASLSEPGHPAEMAFGVRATANFFSTLRVQPQLGRDFRQGEELRGNDRVVIISQRLWQNRFGGKVDIIGRIIRIDGIPHEIVGVLPDSFNEWRHLGWVDLFRPLGLDNEKSTDRRAAMLQLIGRRAGQVSRTEASNFIAQFGARLAKNFPDANTGSTWRTVSLNETVEGRRGGTPAIFAMLIGLSGFVLLIACSNLANLFLARTIARAREFAVRAALGASRSQLLRPLLAESLLLALAGGGFAILIAHWIGDWFSARASAGTGLPVTVVFDGHVFGWALAAALVTALIFDIAPALFALRLDVNETLKSGARGSTGGRGHQRFRHGLIIGQFAFAMVLLAGAALFIRGVYELNNTRAGWKSDHLVSGTILLSPATYANAAEMTTFRRLALERLEALPGVTSASISWRLPYFVWRDTRKIAVEGRIPPQRGLEPAAVVNGVTSRYFETVGTRVLAGRAFDSRDTATSPRVFIINQTMARGLFGNENPIEQRLVEIDGDTRVSGEIVGVVSDLQSVLPDIVPVAFQLYQPLAQEPRAYTQIAVHTSATTAPATILAGVRAAMMELDPDLPIRRLQTAEDSIASSNFQLDVLRDVLSCLAALGLGLAALGIYGIIARTMAQRTGEFAVRLALGAGIGNITRMVLITGVKLALVGAALGLAGAFGVSKLIAAGYPGIHATSVPILIGTTGLLIGIALLACWLPARRAGKVDVIVALRAE